MQTPVRTVVSIIKSVIKKHKITDYKNFSPNYINKYHHTGHMKNVLWYLIAGTKGGITRGKIIVFLRKKPSNAHRIAKMLHLDYKTITHHLRILEKNNIIYAINKGNYGAVYFLSEMFEGCKEEFLKIWDKFGK